MRSVINLFDLTKRNVLITGGAGHIGFRLAQALIELGANVFLLDRNQSTLDDAVEKLLQNASGSQRVSGYEVDLSKPNSIDRFLLQMNEELQVLDVLIQCAAFVGTDKLEGWGVPFKQQSVETWRQCVDVNMTAPFQIVKGLMPLLEESSQPSIIHFSSIYGQVGPNLDLYEGTELGNPAAYAASKAGLAQLTRWLATATPSHFRVNTVTPGGIERGQPQDFMARYNKKVPMGRMGREEDLVGVVCLLASDAGAYINGQDIAVDGGWTAW
ncbi:SDR family oxidoreductase [Marinomonas algicola]|uniref:SDR family oxidoreductase n=1 Tax=Marinomonas algicola TaxID=2773454 RepID=UPI00174A12ED|nr:SDR family oxidoreductase [Marinomonas algicola]